MSPNWVVKLVAATVCAAFAVPPAPAAAARLTINSAGLKRTALIVERDPLKLTRRPLVIVLHGANSNGARVRRRLGLESIASSAKPIFLYPDAIHGHWPVVAGEEAERDVAMLRDMTARLVRQGLVNSRLIFVVGDSTGGAMAIRAVCSGLGQSIAGLATINATMPADLTATCATVQPVAYIAVDAEARSQNPAASGEVAVTGAKIEAAGLPAAVALFGKSAGCTVEPSPAPMVVVDPRTRDVASIERFLGCKAPVERVRIIGDGKAPSVKFGASNDRASRRVEKINVDAAHLVWAFLKKLGA